MARLGLGEEASRLSLQDYVSQWDGPDHIVPQGYGALVEASAREIPIQLGVVVKRVSAQAAGFEIETDQGTFHARTVIVTVSVGVLQAEQMAFEPHLPLSILRALDGLGMGALTKVAMSFDGERFGIKPGEDKIILDASGGAMTFEVWPFDRNIVIAVTGGDAGRDLCQMGERGAVEAAATLFSSLVGQDCRKHLLGGRLAGWWTDPFSRGGYAYAKPMENKARKALMETGIDGLYLAGEATAGGRFGATMTVAGASYAGWDAAKQAAKYLG
jgi:monoamine oxidase